MRIVKRWPRPEWFAWITAHYFPTQADAIRASDAVRAAALDRPVLAQRLELVARFLDDTARELDHQEQLFHDELRGNAAPNP